MKHLSLTILIVITSLTLSSTAWADEAMPWLEVQPQAIPLPAGVWMGLSLFASFGVARLARKRRRRRLRLRV